MKEFQLNFRGNILYTLEHIASTKKSRIYQANVPFMILAEELYAQWNAVSDAKDQEWFPLTFNIEEQKAIWEFDLEFEAFFCERNEAVIKDTEKLLTNNEWINIQLQAEKLLLVLKR